MSKIKMYAVISLDGYIAQVNGDIDFSEKYIKQYDYGFKDFLRTIDCVLFSHRHYTMIPFQKPYPSFVSNLLLQSLFLPNFPSLVTKYSV